MRTLVLGFYKPGSCPGDEPIYVEPYASYHKATIDFSCGLGISADTGDLSILQELPDYTEQDLMEMSLAMDLGMILIITRVFRMKR